jgi:hypothetical protein
VRRDWSGSFPGGSVAFKLYHAKGVIMNYCKTARYEPLNFRNAVNGLWAGYERHGRDLLPLDVQDDLTTPGLRFIGDRRVKRYAVSGKEVK